MLASFHVPDTWSPPAPSCSAWRGCSPPSSSARRDAGVRDENPRLGLELAGAQHRLDQTNRQIGAARPPRPADRPVSSAPSCSAPSSPRSPPPGARQTVFGLVLIELPSFRSIAAQHGTDDRRRLLAGIGPAPARAPRATWTGRPARRHPVRDPPAAPERPGRDQRRHPQAPCRVRALRHHVRPAGLASMSRPPSATPATPTTATTGPDMKAADERLDPQRDPLRRPDRGARRTSRPPATAVILPPYAARRTTASSSTCAPAASCSGEVYSAGLWVMPPRLGTNSIALGHSGATSTLSCPAEATMSRTRSCRAAAGVAQHGAQRRRRTAPARTWHRGRPRRAPGAAPRSPAPRPSSSASIAAARAGSSWRTSMCSRVAVRHRAAHVGRVLDPGRGGAPARLAGAARCARPPGSSPRRPPGCPGGGPWSSARHGSARPRSSAGSSAPAPCR